MSSVLIKGMEMPYCCVVCPFKEMYNDGLLCKATNPYQYIPKFLHKRNEKCPLVEVSTPHGDLIDRNMLNECFESLIGEPPSVALAYTNQYIDLAETVIEAED